MQKQMSKNKKQKCDKWSNIRVSQESKNIANKHLKKANTKKFGRRIKIDELLQIGLNLITEDHIKALQQNSLSFEDRKENLRQVYIKEYGSISKDDFTGFMMKTEYFEFLNFRLLSRLLFFFNLNFFLFLMILILYPLDFKKKIILIKLP